MPIIQGSYSRGLSRANKAQAQCKTFSRCCWRCCYCSTTWACLLLQGACTCRPQCFRQQSVQSTGVRIAPVTTGRLLQHPLAACAHPQAVQSKPPQLLYRWPKSQTASKLRHTPASSHSATLHTVPLGVCLSWGPASTARLLLNHTTHQHVAG